MTVDALIEATARILVKEGYDRASTNKIAEKAGVTIGSLYQYFPNKEALVAAVIDRHTQQIIRLTRDALVKVTMQPLEIAARELVAVAIEAHRVDPTLHRVLAEQIPRVGRLENVEAIDREARALMRIYLESRRDEIGVADLDLAAFVVVTTVEALTHAAVIHNPAVLGDGKVAEFIDEVTRLLLQYLRGGDKGVSKKSKARKSYPGRASA